MATTIQQIELPKKARAVDTSGNNNHGQIYSGRGLEFDGIGDYLDTGYIASAQGITNDITVACWFKTTDVTTGQFTFNFYASNTDALGLKINSSTIFIHGDVDNAGSNLYTTTISSDTWYRVVMVIDSLQAKLYLNGVLIGSGSSIADGLDSFTSNLYIGDRKGSAGDSYFTGMMSDVQVWDSVWSAADVTYDYANPESLALNNSGTALTESNLKLWYPMQDGHRGQQSYILDGANTGLGVELVTNGTFVTDISSWTGASGRGTYTWDNGRAKITNDGASNYPNLYQNPTTVAGQVYKVNATVEIGTTSTIEVRVYDGATLGSQQLTADGEIEFYFTAVGTTPSLHLYLWETGNTGHYCFFDNISVKAINDKHHATTVFYGDELVENGNFAINEAEAQANLDGGIQFDSWTEAPTSGTRTFTAITNGFRSTVGTAQTNTWNQRVSQSVSSDLIIGRTYDFSCSILTSDGSTMRAAIQTAGSSNVQVGGSHATSAGVEQTVSGTFVCSSITDQIIDVWPTAVQASGAYFELKSVTLKEVGIASGWTDADQQLHIPQTALQSYNELAWSDGNAAVKIEVASLAADLGSNDFSISHIINPNNITGNNTYLAFNVGSGDGRVIHRIDDEVVEIYIQDSNAAILSYVAGSGAGAIKAGQTYHIVEVFDRAADLVTVYINGVASGTTIDISSLNGDIDCNGALGFYNFSSDPAIEGFITEVALWKNTKLDATEVLELYNDGKPLDALLHTKASTLYGYWRNNGLSTWVNLANPGTKDTTTNTLTQTILIPQGVDSTRDAQGFIMNKEKSTSCLNLTSKSGGYVRVQDNSNVQLASTAASWVFWVKLDSLSDGDQKLISKAASTGNPSSAYQIRTNSQQLLLQIYSGGWRSDARSSFFTSTDWVHVVVTIDGSNNVNFYKNGDVFGSEADIGYAVPANTGGLHIGIRAGAQGSTEFLKGQIDGVLLYNKELDSTEVLKNYKATKGNHRN